LKSGKKKEIQFENKIKKFTQKKREK
jgi:hypothetical protein